ncbi:rhodanese [Sphingomonas faeni]|uniref:rhodanese n=1 Tax=Sphingomonas faeni TaxID=185950 RepID=UPI0020C7E588|nr:rhodanese [Sphingomonas faeni]MCP8892003.1 rhodanese [Sphingomonas faeni]
MMMFAAAVAVAVAGQSVAPAPDTDPATGYRTAHYRAIVPAAPEGVPRIDTATVARLLAKKHAILIDVMPAEGGVRDAATGVWRLARPRPSIAGAHWFPEAGRGVVDPGIATWFETGIASLRGKRDPRPLIVFCLADCWMSWNASRRLAKAGYGQVYWYADGTDGWSESGRPLVDALPFRTHAY